jgi:hypothetical protein
MNSDLTDVENIILRERLLALLSGFFTVVAAILAAIGLYGVLRYSVSRCTKDVGIRLTLEAPHDSVVWLIIRQITPAIAAGLTACLAGELILLVWSPRSSVRYSRQVSGALRCPSPAFSR